MIEPMINVGVLLGFNLTNASLIQVRYGNGGQVGIPMVNRLTWAMMGFTAVAAFSVYHGCYQPLIGTTPGSVNWVLAATGIVCEACALAAAFVIWWVFEFEADMEDPAIFKAWGVPFVPALAMFCNFFLLAITDFTHIGTFGIFVVVIVLLYGAQVAIGTDKQSREISCKGEDSVSREVYETELECRKHPILTL
uniref:Cationic amino acid transporter C-terminal domain-containing protein n=1 Tax=Zooxanthella nutricula TaxID=1333877 RepID=A0A7S2K228_9DINO